MVHLLLQLVISFNYYFFELILCTVCLLFCSFLFDFKYLFLLQQTPAIFLACLNGLFDITKFLVEDGRFGPLVTEITTVLYFLF